MRARPWRGLPAAALSAAALGAGQFLAASPGRADGSLPPLPYRYLHPPGALAGTNQQPLAGTLTVPVLADGTGQGYGFTDDGQAGITAYQTNFKVPAGTKSIRITIRPVNTPPGLPSSVAADGNAYRVTAASQPGNHPVHLVQRASITLRWPHIPSGMDVYQSGRWSKICGSLNSILTSSTLTCRTPTLGIFTAVAPPSAVGIHVPATPGISSSPFAWINQYIPLLAALVLIIIAAVLGYFVTRPDRSRGSTNRKRPR